MWLNRTNSFRLLGYVIHRDWKPSFWGCFNEAILHSSYRGVSMLREKNEGGAETEAEWGRQKGRENSKELMNGFPVSRKCNALLSLDSWRAYYMPLINLPLLELYWIGFFLFHAKAASLSYCSNTMWGKPCPQIHGLKTSASINTLFPHFSYRTSISWTRSTSNAYLWFSNGESDTRR